MSCQIMTSLFGDDVRRHRMLKNSDGMADERVQLRLWYSTDVPTFQAVNV